MDLSNLAKGNRPNESLILEEIKNVIESENFFSDRLVEKFEDKLKNYTGVDYCISCSSGSDALLISLLAFGIGPGDEVIIPDFSFVSPGTLVKILGATPIFVDVDPITFNIDPHSFKSAITENTKAVIAVSSFGQISDLDEIIEISNNEGIFVIEEGSQSFGAERNGRKSGSIANCSTTCFAPGNTLGSLGKAGAIFTRDEKLAEKIKSIRNWGLGSNSHYYNLGIDGRMESLHAAVLSIKIDNIEKDLEYRNKIAQVYSRELSGFVNIPEILVENNSVWSEYTIRVNNRDALADYLRERKMTFSIKYSIPLSQQDVFRDEVSVYNPVSEKLSEEVISLPISNYISIESVLEICGAIKEFFSK